MWRWDDVKMARCEDEKMWRLEDQRIWRWEDVKTRRWEDVRMRKCEGKKMRRCEDEKMWRQEDEKMWRWEDVKMFEDVYDRPPLFKEPFAQTLSGKKHLITVPRMCNRSLACSQIYGLCILESFQLLLNCHKSLEVFDLTGTQHNATHGNSQLPFVWGSWPRFSHEQHWTGAHTTLSWISLWKETWMQVVSGPDLKARIMGMLTQILHWIHLETFLSFVWLCFSAELLSDADWGIDSDVFSSLAVHHC